MKKFEKKSAGPLERLRLKSGIYAASFTVLAIILSSRAKAIDFFNQ